MKNPWVIENFYGRAYFTCFLFLDWIYHLCIGLCWKPDRTISTPGIHAPYTRETIGHSMTVIPYDSYVSPIDKAWIWFDRNLFESINVPVSSHQYHLDPFLFFEILKPIPNLNFYVLVFFWSNQNYFESKEEVLISNEKFNWYQFGSEAHPAMNHHWWFILTLTISVIAYLFGV